MALDRFQKESSRMPNVSVRVRECLFILRTPVQYSTPPLLHIILDLGNKIFVVLLRFFIINLFFHEQGSIGVTMP